MKSKILYLALVLAILAGCRGQNDPSHNSKDSTVEDLMNIEKLFASPCEYLQNSDSGAVYIISNDVQLKQINPQELPIYINFKKSVLVYIKIRKEFKEDCALFTSYTLSDNHTQAELQLDCYRTWRSHNPGEDVFVWAVYPKEMADSDISISFAYHKHKGWGLFGILDPINEVEWIKDRISSGVSLWFGEAILRDKKTYEIVYAYHEMAWNYELNDRWDHNTFYDRDGEIIYQYVALEDSVVDTDYQVLGTHFLHTMGPPSRE